MTEDTTYNGWKNYPTWCVNLWLSNDEGLYNEVRHLEKHSENAYQLSQMLKTMVRDELAPDLGATFAADLLGYAFDLVDWYEIAEAWVKDMAEAEA